MTTVVVHPDAATLAAATGARLLLSIVDAQSHHRPVHVGLTGGTMGIRLLAEAARHARGVDHGPRRDWRD